MDPKIDVIKDFSVFFNIYFIVVEKVFNSDGNNKKVIRNETIRPKVIIHPKSIIGLMPLNIKDRKAK